MRALHGLVLFLVTGFGLPTGAQSQWAIPEPVDLQIQNIPQETGVWCWAAVAEQIILSLRGPYDTPPQCALVAMANGRPPDYCCSRYQPDCVRTGSLEQIQYLIGEFGGAYSSQVLPTDPMTLYNALRQDRAIIMAVQATPWYGHVVVIRGMEWAQTLYGFEPVLYVNDPMNYFTQPIPFWRIAQYWRAAIVVY